MTIYKIFTPNPQFCGERAGVVFTAGFGVTSNADVADELRRMGYHVHELIDPCSQDPCPQQQEEPLVTTGAPSSANSDTSLSVVPHRVAAEFAPVTLAKPDTVRLSAHAEAKRPRTKRG